jgi:hypothetical protein
MSIDIIKEERNDGSKELLLISENGYKFRIHYAACDLYWTMINYDENNEIIVKKNDLVLYKEIEKIFDLIGDISELEWYSEAYGEIEDANKLFISKKNDQFAIKFFQNPNRIVNRKGLCPICFCLSGSMFQNVANEFSLMFHRLSNNLQSKSSR